MSFLPRESATTRAVMGPTVSWSDSEYLMALLVDRVGYLAWMFAQVNSKKGSAPNKPPKPVQRPVDLAAVEGEEATVNLTDREVVAAGSLSLEEMDRAVSAQTGTRRGFVEVV